MPNRPNFAPGPRASYAAVAPYCLRIPSPAPSVAWVVLAALVQKLRAGDDHLDQAAELILIGRKLNPHPVERLSVRRQQPAPQRVREQLSAQVLDVIVLPFIAQVLAQALQPVPLLAVG